MLETQKQMDNQTQQTEIPYAIVKLEEAARIIRQSINELPILRKRLEKNIDVKPKAREIYGDLQNQHRRLLGAFDTVALSLLEIEQDELANHSVKLGQSIKSFNLMTPDYTKLCEALNSYLSRLPFIDSGEINADCDITTQEAKATNNRIIGRLMNNVRMGYYPTCTDNLVRVVDGIDFPDGVTTNLLDPCCGCGLALRFIAEKARGKDAECKTYGIELDGYRAEEALTRLDRVGFGSFYHSRISNEAFHAMLLNPPYLSLMTEGGNNTRSEKRFLVDSINNLMMDGLLIYIIPYYRLTPDIARILCDNFNDISVWKFTSGEFKKFKQIAILGTRHKRRDGSIRAHELSSSALEPDKLPELTELPIGRYQLPAISKEVTLFKGAMFNKVELAEQLSNSKSLTRLFQKSKLDSITKRPLLPLSIGQIGLVGGSGLINGLVECDSPHIIKGRIVKEKRTRANDNINSRGDLSSTTITETISNKLIFNILTPNGFLSLTDYGDDGAIVNPDNGPNDDANSSLGHSNSCDTNRLSSNNSFDSNNKICLSLGTTVITPAAHEVLADYEINNALRRHQIGDWGDVSKDDWEANNDAIKYGERILSAYKNAGSEKFWIITEWDRSVTTVLLPGDY